MKKVRLAFLLVPLVALLSSCGGGGGGGGGTSITGDGSVAYAVRNSAPLGTCPNGGISVDTGIDQNGNGILDAGEITSTQYVCNGAHGMMALVSVTSETAGANCAAGGKKVSAGLDDGANGGVADDGILQPGEATSSDYICNGNNGTNGQNSLIAILTEPASVNCQSGGLKISSGLDSNTNGVLDTGEAGTPSYVCNGPASVIIQSITADPPVVRPGENTMLMVSANDGAGSALTYSWSGEGSFTSTNTSTTTWTAPSTVGSYMVNVQASNGVSTVTGYATVLVSVSPAGPIITNVSPSEARSGDTITITGAGFGTTQGSSTVYIGGTAAMSIASWSENLVKAVVPSGATTGTVIISSGGASSSPGYIAIPWNEGNLGLTTMVSTVMNPRIISDGAGGAIITWQDNRYGDYDIFAQRVNSAGTAQWIADGVAISTATGDQSAPQLISDGSGGAIITWQDNRSGSLDIYAQRVNGAGTVQWFADGAAISTAVGLKSTPQLVSDGSGGAIITWRVYGIYDYDIYAQRVNSAGTAQWFAYGVAISTAIGHQSNPQLISDGSGGAIITWEDNRYGNYAIYAQRVNSAGMVQWTADGVAISTAAGLKSAPQVISDGSGGAIITWRDRRSGLYDIYAQRVNSAGMVQWTADGVAISTAAGDQSAPKLISDGSGGAIITWQDNRSWSNDIYAQRVDIAGTVQWIADGVAISTATGNQSAPQLISDGSGGAIITWYDNRNGNGDIYAQRVNIAGMVQWTADGVAISTATGDQSVPQLISDGSGGAIITWYDSRNGNGDIYAQRVNGSGQW